MKEDTLNFAIKEAESFLKKAKELRALAREEKYFPYTSPKLRGSVKRASMELTRSLADLRRHD